MTKKKAKKPDIEVLPSIEQDEQQKLHGDEVPANLPAILGNREIAVLPNRPSDPLSLYVKEINQYKLLSPEQEAALTKALKETGDIEIAKELVMANLRLVVKIAMEYRSSYRNVMDLIQEGNIGLMKAVSKYDPEAGTKLSYYASWWIRSYILKFILDNFRLVKIGTTNEQKKLFYNLMREKNRLESLGIKPDTKTISENLGVSTKAVELMDYRLSDHGGEVSFDAPLGHSEDSANLLDVVGSSEGGLDEDIAHRQGLNLLKTHMKDFLAELKPRDREIFEKRLLSDVPETLQAIADDYGVSRERIRQIESRLMDKLKVYMSDIIS